MNKTTMIIKQALQISTHLLRTKKIKTAALDAEVLLAHILNKSREFLYTNPEKPLYTSQRKKFMALIKKRAACIPVAYLIGTKEFYGREFFVDRHVLIPRPDTEILIDTILEYCQKYRLASPTIADIGTGSGCIAITLALELPKAKIYATDISKKTFLVAKKNARRYRTKTTFFYGALLKPLKGKHIDIIAANLPYGWKAWKNNTSAEAIGLHFEPERGLFTKEHGLYLYRLFFGQLSGRAQKPPLVLCEFDPRQLQAIKRLITRLLPTYQLKTKKDLAGLHRVAILHAKNSSV